MSRATAIIRVSPPWSGLCASPPLRPQICSTSGPASVAAPISLFGAPLVIAVRAIVFARISGGIRMPDVYRERTPYAEH